MGYANPANMAEISSSSLLHVNAISKIYKEAFQHGQVYIN
jgi:hypothetical protein